MILTTSRRQLPLERTLVMAILNVTPDSFSDGGQLADVDDALRRAESVIAQGADILDIGGESTRPGSSRVSAEVEVTRVVPVIEAIAKRFDTPISIDTSKAQVASRAVDAGAEIINDVSGLRWDPGIAGIAAANNTGLVLMHSLGEFETMHTQEPVADIVGHVIADFNRATAQAVTAGVNARRIVLDIGIGFGKTFEQNLELLANIDKINAEFPLFPILAGASRKSFIGKILDEPEPQRRLNGSVAAAVVAVTNGAKIVRVHDVKETVDAVRIADAIRDRRKQA